MQKTRQMYDKLLRVWVILPFQKGVTVQGNFYTREGDLDTCAVVNLLKNWLLVQRKIFCFIYESTKPTVV
jgi:hypothetical protein